MNKVLHALEDYWKNQGVRDLENRRGPVSESDLKRLQDCVENFPLELAQLLKWEDGDPPRAFWLGIGSAWYLLPASRIEKNLISFQRSRGTLQSVTRGDIGAEELSAFIPFVLWNGTIFGVVDAESSNGAVYGIDFEECTLVDWGVGLEGFFSRALSKLQSGEKMDLAEFM